MSQRKERGGLRVPSPEPDREGTLYSRPSAGRGDRDPPSAARRRRATSTGGATLGLRRFRSRSRSWRPAGCWCGEPLLPGGQCAWVAPARDPEGRELVLKAGWRHPEAEHEADALRLWDGDGAIRCVAEETCENTIALLLERCTPGTPLKSAVPEPDQDVVIAGLLRRLWDHDPPEHHPFRPLHEMCDDWADSFERDFDTDGRGLEPASPMTRSRCCMSCLAAPATAWCCAPTCTPRTSSPASVSRGWRSIRSRLSATRLRRRPAHAQLQRSVSPLIQSGWRGGWRTCSNSTPSRSRLWLFARCAHESMNDPAMRTPAALLAP